MATDLEAAPVVTEVIPQQEIWPISRLHPDPANQEIFDPLTDSELSDLADSIKQDGILNPITIRPDGTIIAGAMRYEAALRAGLHSVPVRVFDVDDKQVIRLRITENLKRRNVKASETIRAIVVLADTFGVDLRATVARKTQTGGAGVLRDIQSSLVTETGMSARSLNRYVGYLKLTDEIKELLDQEVIHTHLADQLCKLPPEYQKELALVFNSILSDKSLTKREYQEQFNTLTEQVKSLTDEKSSVETRLQEILENPPSFDDPRIETLEDELEELNKEIEEYLATLNSKNEENDKLRQDLKFHEYIQRSDKLNKAIKSLCEIVSISPQDCVENFTTRLGAELILKTHHSMLVKSVIPWLEEYVGEIDKVLGQAEAASAEQTLLEEGSVLHLPKSKVKRKGT